MSNERLTALTFSHQVEHYANEHECRLLEAMVAICDRHSVPYEDVCRHVVDGARVNLISAPLKQRLEAQCLEDGLLQGRRNMSYSLTDFL